MTDIWRRGSPATRRYLAFALVAIAGVLSIALFSHSDASTAQQSTWLRITPRPFAVQLGLVGQLESAGPMIITAPFDGTVLAMPIEPGQDVKQGQLLLQLDASQMDIQVRQALADLIKAQGAAKELEHWGTSTEVMHAKRALSTQQMTLNATLRKQTETRSLYERGIVPRMELDELDEQAREQTLSLASAQGDLAALQEKANGDSRRIAQLELANAQAKYQALLGMQAQRQLIAPQSGTLVRPPDDSSTNNQAKQPLQAGSHVVQGQALFGIANRTQLQIRTKVNEVDIGKLQIGQAVDITGDGFNGIALQGKVSAIASQVAPTEGNDTGVFYQVTVALPPLTTEQQQKIRLGMSAKLAIVLYRNVNAMVVPADAIHQDQPQPYVIYRSEEGGSEIKVPVRIGQSAPDGVEVFGLKPGWVMQAAPLQGTQNPA